MAANADQPEGLQFTSTPKFSNVPATTARTMRAITSIKAPASAENARRSLDLVIVIDCSGSMSGNKINMTKDAARFLISQLNPGDNAALISFATEVTTKFELTSATAAQKGRMLDHVNGLRAGGLTHLSGAIGEALTVARGKQTDNAVRSVLLFTDGHPSTGVTGAHQIVEMVKSLLDNAEHAQTTLYTFGFGEDHDANLLRGISEAGSGMYYYLQNEQAIGPNFADCLGGLQSVYAQNIRLAFKSLGGTRFNAQHSRFRVVGTGSFPCSEFTLSVGDMFCEEERDILMDIELPATDEAERSLIASFELTYFDLRAMKERSAVTEMYISRLPEAIECAPNVAVVDQELRVDMDRALREAQEALRANDAGLARERMRGFAAAARTTPHTSAVTSVMADDIDGMVSTGTLSSNGLTSMAMQYQYQRSSDRTASHTNEAKLRMRDAFARR